MSFYGYTQLVNVNDWKIDHEFGCLTDAVEEIDSNSVDFNEGDIIKINYNIYNDGYDTAFTTDKTVVNRYGSKFNFHGATWVQNQGYDGTIWRYEKEMRNISEKPDEIIEVEVYALTKIANTNSVIPQISVDLYSPSYGEENSLPKFDADKSNPAGFIMQASPQWKIEGQLIGEQNCLSGPTATIMTKDNFIFPATADDILNVTEILGTHKDDDGKDVSNAYQEGDDNQTDTKQITLNLTTLNSALGLLYNIIYGTDDDRAKYFEQGATNDYLDSSKKMPGLLSFLQQDNNEVTYEKIALTPKLSNQELTWTTATEIASTNATSIELLVDEDMTIANINQAIYCNFEISKWEGSEITIKATSNPANSINLILKYTH